MQWNEKVMDVQTRFLLSPFAANYVVLFSVFLSLSQLLSFFSILNIQPTMASIVGVSVPAV